MLHYGHQHMTLHFTRCRANKYSPLMSVTTNPSHCLIKSPLNSLFSYKYQGHSPQWAGGWSLRFSDLTHLTFGMPFFLWQLSIFFNFSIVGTNNSLVIFISDSLNGKHYLLPRPNLLVTVTLLCLYILSWISSSFALSNLIVRVPLVGMLECYFML